MPLTANQIPIHEWPQIAASYMAVRILLSQVSVPRALAVGYVHEARRICLLTDFARVTTAEDLMRYREYLCDLLSECEDELQ
jgi:hypothetical protein